MLADIRRAKKMGLEHGAYEGNELQLPAVFIVDKAGIVQDAHYAKNAGDLPDSDRLLAPDEAVGVRA